MTETGIHPSRRFSLDRTFAALKHPNYRLWFYGQLVSLFGSWMQATAEGYLVFELTHSPAYLGYVTFASGVPSWLLMLYAGVVADRVSRRAILVVTQTVQMLLALTLATLAFLHVVQPWHIIVLAFALGIANAFDAPARQAFVLEMVARDDLTNAIALNATMFNLAVAIGPTAGGLTYAAFGPAWCFLINGLSFLAVIVALLLMKIPGAKVHTRHTSALIDLREGLRYAARHPTIRGLIMLMGVASLFAISYATLVPAWAVNVLGGDARTNGLLLSARGVGATSAGLAIASLGRITIKGRLLTIGTFVFPLALLAFALARWLPLSLAALFIVGAAQMLVMNLANAVVQTQVADDLRGRVMGIYSLIFLGFYPIGGLLAGAVAQAVGSPTTVTLGALCTLAFAVLAWLLLPQLRAAE